MRISERPYKEHQARIANRAAMASVDLFDAVEHTGSGETGVLIEKLNSTQVVVQTTPGVSVVWYVLNVRSI